MRPGNRLALSTTALGVLAATAVAWGVNEPAPATVGQDTGQRIEKRWDHRRGGAMAHLARRLDLSDEQRAAIEEIVRGAGSESEELRARLQDMRAELGTMIRDSGYYEDQVRMLVESNASAFVELTVLRVRTMSEIYAVLTPEQQARADALLQGRAGRFGPRHRPRFPAP